jgi:serine/threonine protein kinase
VTEASDPVGRRYAIVEAIGKGAFGTVYRARLSGEGAFSKEVAIKLLRSDLGERSEKMAMRQRDEARLLGLVRHRAILHVDGLVRLNGSWAVVMELVDGCNLKDALRLGAFPPSVAVAVCGEVAGALSTAWEATTAEGKPLRLIHRDIKPPNIQLTAAGDVKLLDFGIARAQFEGREAETVDMLLGTLRYMAPERFDAVDGPAGDVYALGIVLVELLTRKPMPKTSSNPERHEATLDTALERLTEALEEEEGDPEALVGLVQRMLAYAPDERPTAREVERTLYDLRRAWPRPRPTDWAADRVPKVQALVRPTEEDPLVGTTLVEQSSVGRVTPAPRPSRRRWVWSVLLLLLLLLLGGGGVGGLALLAAWNTATVSVVAPEPEPEPEPELAVAPEPEPEPAVAPEPEPVVAPEPAPRPAAPRPEPKPAPAPAAAPTGKVVVVGDPATVRLRAEDGTERAPGAVPVGRYAVLASFGGPSVEVTAVTVTAGGTIELKCMAAFQLCKATAR